MSSSSPVQAISTVDYHTAGEPFRIVLDGVPEIPGATVGERRVFAQGSDEIDRIRRLLCHEPRGHADMYGGFLTPPNDNGADFGVLFWHKDGFSTACGHGTIALGVWAVETGRVDSDPDGETIVTIDVPSGRVEARVLQTVGRITSVTFRNVESWAIATAVPVETSRGTFHVDLSYSGAIYASLNAADAGLEVTARHYPDIIAIGREIKWKLNDHALAQHPTDPRLSGVYGTIVYDDFDDTEAGPHQRNATVFADGEVDRSPCGSGTGARVALLAASGRLKPGQVFTHDSIVDTRFLARVFDAPAGATSPDGHPMVVPEVQGMAYQTGEHRFTLNTFDDVGTGFVLR